MAAWPEKEDSAAAYTHALLWFITQDERHASKVRDPEKWTICPDTTALITSHRYAMRHPSIKWP